MSVIFLIILGFVMSFSLVYSHEGLEDNNVEDDHELESSLYDFLMKSNLIIILISGGIVLFFVLLSLHSKKKSKKLKLFLFLGIIIPIILSTTYSAVSTIFLNTVSSTKGPVHWHADFEIWACGEKYELIDPQGISNRVGSPVFHEHNDNRMHVEGVVMNKEDAKLHHFFEFIDGELSNDRLRIITNRGTLEKTNWEQCPDGRIGNIQVFVYRTKNAKYFQEKIHNYEDYVLSPYQTVPPGDCIIIDFDEEKPMTEHICTTYRLAIERGELSGG
ncbi:MAG: hypothetical protein AABY14_00290 [Nanoarchaeota archaeon]